MENKAQQALHQACLVAYNGPNTTIILVIPYQIWHHVFNPHNGPFPYSHVITHFKTNIITYKEPTIPPKVRIEPRMQNHAIHILYIHHKNTPFGFDVYTYQMNIIANTLQIIVMFTQIVPPTPSDTTVNRN